MFPLLLALLAAGPAPVTLSTDWPPENRSRLEAWFSALTTQPGRKVAAFDWDNTMIKNDVGDALVFHMLAHDLVRAPVTWATTSRHLTPKAGAALTKTCRADGGYVQTSSEPACADLVLGIYLDGKLPGGKPAWKPGYDAERFEPGYAWAVQLTQGYTPDEVRRMAGAAIEASLASPVGAKRRVGTRDVSAYLRVYEPMKQLVTAATEAGVEVWIVSASGQYVVETFAARVGVPPERVIGIRPVLDKSGRITAGLAGCGWSVDGGQDVITYKKGKRCWINKVIFAERDPQRQLVTASALTFAAGDADTDIAMVSDAALRLVINRNKREISCAAVTNADGNWLLQPMFIEPVPLRIDCPRAAH